jgi:thiol-disulfide isomerase/thioredoxin
MKPMKNRKALLIGAATVLCALLAVNAAAQDDKMMADKMSKPGESMMMDKSKPIVAIIRADWCPACQRLEPTMKELREQYKDRLNFVVLDVTNDEKVLESTKTARELGLEKFFEDNKKNTSTVVVFGEKNKVSFKTDHNYERAAYVRAFDKAIEKHSMMMKKS